MNRTGIVMLGGVALLLIASGVWQFRTRPTEPPPVVQQPVTEPKVATPSIDVTAVAVTPVSHSATTSFALATGDTVTSWNFKGAYTGNPELVTKARDEIARLSGLLATATSSAMILDVGIANQYELLGDGKNQYDYLGRATQADPAEGLPWHNLGVLMERLGALRTARAAYEKATLLQPQYEEYQYAYLQFLIQNMKSDTAGIEKAFAAATKDIGATSYLAELRSEWHQP